MRLLSLTVPLLVLPAARAATGGPDGGDAVYTDSLEADGPSHVWLDATGGDAWPLGDDETTAVDLPFDFTFYGTAYDQVTISSNGVVFFAGATTSPTGICPAATGTWTGIAAYWTDLAASTVHTETFGSWPDRTFVISWDNVAHGTAGGAGSFQVWLLEGRDEAVVVLDDLTFGDASVDRGLDATIGTNAYIDGLPWSCSSSFSDGTSVWFAAQGSRPARPTAYSSELGDPWYGQADFDYSGRALATGDFNGDGTDDLLVGTQDRGDGEVALVYRPDAPENLGNADATFQGGSSNSDFGAALTAGDLDGDGLEELVVGAPSDTTGGSGAGRVSLWQGGVWTGDSPAATADTTWLGPASYSLGSSLATGDIDGDGYADLLLGAPNGDSPASNAGAIYLVYGGSIPAGGTSTATDATIRGTSSGDQFGSRIATGDLDGDGADDFAVSALFDDDGATNAGTVFVFDGARLSGTLDAGSDASCTTSTPGANARLGSALLIADVDGSGLFDLVIGGSTEDGTYTDGGKAYLFADPGLSCPGTVSLADATISGLATSANLGSSLAAADFDDDGVSDLVIGAPNMAVGATGGGAAYIFTTAPSGSVNAGSSQHVVAGSGRAAALATSLAVAENPGEAPTLYAGAPYDSYTRTSEGTVYQWSYAPDFLDEDGDGFVSAAIGGNDCDDTESGAVPGGTDTDGDSIDGDCDGWVDGVVRVRTDATGWAWDLADVGGGDTDTYDFESYTAGDTIDVYADLTFAGDLTAATSAYGSTAVDTLCARLLPGATNSVGIAFADGIDGLALRVLDPDDTYTLVATGADGTVVSGYEFNLAGDDRPGGVYRGFVFASEVTAITLTSTTATDGFGIDELEVAWAADSDRDGDGYSDAEGDCDDGDAAISPDATEDLTNGIDDDCDGVIDAGDATAWTDPTDWAAAAGIDSQTIDFEDLSGGEVVSTQYEDLGAAFDSTLSGIRNVFGTPAHDTMAARNAGYSSTIYFTEEQPAIAFYLLDGEVTFTVTAYQDGIELYTTTFTPGSTNSFYGLTFDLPVDSITISGTDDWGLDDITFSVLGLDDADGDGLTESEGDCDDADATVYTGATETWYDGVDGDCLGGDDYDADGDGSAWPTDCDDTDADTNPSATETWYDGIDQDCDGASDYDADGDGHDDPSFGGDDCDDTDDAVSPDATETWYDGVDQDCAGDDDYDADGDGFPIDGTLGTGDCDDEDAGISPDAAEIFYDGIDQDCSGEEESDFDADGDGHDATAWGGDDCEDTEPTAYPGATGDVCRDGVDTDCDGANDYDCDADGYTWDGAGGDDCDDDDATVNPGAIDIIGDGLDTNCDDAPDYDYDSDGYDGDAYGGTDCDDGNAAVNPGVVDTCYDGLDANCDDWDDDDCDLDGFASDLHGGTDCDDDVGAINPGATDYPYDGVDSDCDGGSEYDLDGDGQTTDWYGGTDCDDTDDAIYAGASDTCYDGVDSDCGGEDDDDCDGDGYAIDTGSGGDCDDTDASIHPTATEVDGDGIDQDCDGADVEVCTDCDGDGFQVGTDCDDTDASVYPGAPETDYDGIDADCDGGSDYDADGDGVDAIAWGGGDCDDSNPAISPTNTVDDCRGGDEDCDGEVDEDCDLGGHTDDTAGTDDTGPVIVDTATRDTAVDWRPDPDELVDPEMVERTNNCGCSTPGGSSSAFAGVLLAGAALARRRRG